jgi:hypothetical protein
MKRFTTILAAALALGVAAQAQVINLNEIYVSHAGTDDQEYVELIGTPNMSIDYLMVLVVEGDSGTTTGKLDRAWQVSGNMPADGFFVLGGDLVANLDLSVGSTNLIENGTETIYLVDAVDQAGADALVALLDTVVDLGGGVTSIPTLCTVIDIIAIVDGGYGSGDLIYDGATPLGPDGTYLPGGIYRGGDFPNAWCDDAWLDYDDVANLDMPRTPGTGNVDCPVTASCAWYCGAGTNMDTYVVTTGYVLGGTFQGSVGFVAPNLGAVVAGYLGQLTFPIWGQEGLVDVTKREVMGVPSTFGASPVVISWTVPNDPSYAGMHVFTQSAAVGGGVINLTCAFDCTVGY